jgi:hypothetical protein
MSINLLAILLAAVAGMATGALWFAPFLFGRPWRAAAGVTTAPNWVYPVAFAATLVTSAVLVVAASVAHDALGGGYLLVAVGTGALLWLGFTVGRTAVEYLFEQRSSRLFAIDMGHQLATVLVMAVVIGLLGR